MAKKKEKILFAKGALLNKAGHNSTAAISASVINNYGENPSIDLQITDCYRAITFDFSVHDAADNSLYKLDTLIGILTDFRDAVSKACDNAVLAQEKREKREKKVRKAKKLAKNKKNEPPINL